MSFLIGFNMVTTVLWFFIISDILSKAKKEGKIKNYEMSETILTTVVFETLTLFLTIGMYMMLK